MLSSSVRAVRLAGSRWASGASGPTPKSGSSPRPAQQQSQQGEQRHESKSGSFTEFVIKRRLHIVLAACFGIAGLGLYSNARSAMPKPPDSPQSKRAVCLVRGDTVRGVVHFQQQDDGSMEVSGEFEGLAPGEHGVHVHEYGDTSRGEAGIGPHLNPYRVPHGSPAHELYHAGDLGNVTAGPDGRASLRVRSRRLTLAGMAGVAGRALAVTEGADQLGADGSESGGGGAPVAVGVIGVAPP